MTTIVRESLAYTFSGWEIRGETRQLVTPSGTAELEPRAFDLLMYLIENRHRIVSKDELLNEVWKTTHVSESVLSRAIMKIRRGFTEQGVEGEWIRTLHRVGYQFVGEQAANAPDAVGAPAASAGSIKRIAFLPFENHTGDATLDWMELGLLTMVARAVAASNVVAVDGLDRVLVALSLLEPKAGLEQKIQQLRNALGVERVVRTTVAAIGHDQYCLSWSVWLLGNVISRGEVKGAQVTALALAMARQLTEALGATKQTAQQKIDLTRDADFALAAHGRACQAFAQERYSQALAFIRVCMDMDQHPFAVDVDHVLITGAVDANEAVRLGTALLDRIDWVVHPHESATLLRAMADAALRRYEFDYCEALCEQARDHLDAEKDYETFRSFVFCRFVIAFQRGDATAAREIVRSWVERARERADSFDLASVLGNLGMLELQLGDWGVGEKMIDEANQLARTFKIWATVAANLTNLAGAHSARGRVREAYALNNEALELVRLSGQGMRELPILCNIYTDAWELGDHVAALEYIAKVKEHIRVPSPWEVSHFSQVIDAEMRFGDVDKAQRGASESVERILALSGSHNGMGVYLTVMVAARALRQASDVIAQISDSYAIPSFAIAHANYLLATAQLAYANGDDSGAYGIVERYIANRGGLCCGSRGATDLVWLAMERGLLDDAIAMAAEISDHLTQTLRGNCVAARLYFEQQEPEKAAVRQQLVVKMASGRRLLPYLMQLLQHYEAAARGDACGQIPRAPLLPSAF